MGDLTRDQLVTEICDIVGKKLTAVAVSGTSLQSRVQTYYLNWGQRRIARTYAFEELNAWKTDSATVASVKRYPLSSGTNNLGLTNPKDILAITLQNSQNSRRLTAMNYRRFERKFPRPENYTTGIPSLYVRYGNQLELFRIPDAAYTLSIRYSQWPTAFTTASQLSDYNNKDELLVAAGVLETYLALEEYSDGATWTAKYLGLMRDAILDEGEPDWEPEPESDTFPNGINGTPWASPEGYPEDPLFGVIG